MSAGVGLVFILRWFWWRVNAWSQLSAMIASLIYTLSFDFLYNRIIGFKEIIDSWILWLDMDYYPFKVYVLTVAVTITWLIVTFLTPADEIRHLKIFAYQTKTGGIWPFKIPAFNWGKKLLLILLFVIISSLPLWIIWEFKFDSSLLAIGYLVVWILLSAIIYFQMKKLILVS